MHISLSQLAIPLYVALFAHGSLAQTSVDSTSSANPPALTTESVAPLRFIAAHGRRSLISGYASGGLEIWAYPLEIVDNYRVSFRPVSTTTPIEGQTILRRVIYNRDSITRLYLGPNFTVRETLFVPLNKPGAILTYSVQSAQPVAIHVHATPILNLMWPAAIGGQSTAWSSSLCAFVLSEPENAYSAVVGSPDIVAHDDSGNRTTQGTELGFTLRPISSGKVSVYVALNSTATKSPETLFQDLITNQEELRDEYDQHVSDQMNAMMAIVTPDERVNRAIAWSELALDQAWVCNPDLGCGYVAGYGPSRDARRPQYDWFFAGDGLIAANGAASAGNISQAREEIEFILRYQDKKTGMIWHELSQSAGLIDWVAKYPYMYVHVDITFQFLGTLARFAESSGDRKFIRDHWTAIAAAYHYCETLIDPDTGLPRIPTNKEGGDEQDRMSEDLGLSVSWVEASAAFQQLATLAGHGGDAAQAQRANQVARSAIPNRYWDAQNRFWISGFAASGKSIPERRSSPGEAIGLNLFTTQENHHLLDELASATFQTDWGTRGVAAGSEGFDPTSYAKGSVSALGTAELATTFWSAHRSTQAFALWNSLLPWTILDSLGHFHEVLAGNIYQPQEESVPEQTWSSAEFITATIQGLLGLQVDALDHKLTFAPHLPPTWHDVSLEHVPLFAEKITLMLHETDTSIELAIENPGPPFSLRFAPTLPLGSSVDRVEVNGRNARAITSQNLPDTMTILDVAVQHGSNKIRMALHGGISFLPTLSTPLLGEPSHSIHLIDARLVGNNLTITADIPADQEGTMDIATRWTIVKSTNATVEALSPMLDRITFSAPKAGATGDHYRRVEATLQIRR